MSTAKINGVDIHYEVSGEGPAVVWLHGGIQSIERSRLVGERLDALADRGFRMIWYDARGHGQSGHSDDEAGYTWAALAEDMRGLLDHLGIERAIVGGHSIGAGASIMFALAYPERVEKLVLLVPPPLADTIGPAQQNFGGLASLIEALGVQKAVEVVMNLPMYKEMAEQDPQRCEQTRQWLLGVRPDAAVAVRGLLFGPPLPEERFAEITAPTLIIGQPDDQIHPVSTVEKLHAAIAGSQVVMAPAFEYYRTHEDELVETVAGFLRDNVAAR